jgi:NAD(P)-dependent dehydrogenase (short-subunit alcohol dehydrogenase family)
VGVGSSVINSGQPLRGSRGRAGEFDLDAPAFSGGIVRDNPQVNKAVADHTAFGRAGVPDDVGPVIAALLSDDLGWVNAQRIEVAGGVHI